MFTCSPAHLFTRFPSLQQTLNIINIIKRIIDEELKFRHDPELVMQIAGQHVPDFAAVLPYLFQQALLVFRQEEAQVDFGDGQILGYLHFGDGDQGAIKKVAALLLKDRAQLLLDEARNFLLSR